MSTLGKLACVCVAIVAISACGIDSDNDHNAQDVSFATGMIPHHVQAVEMAELAATRTSNDQIKALAAQIRAAQQPEIDAMNRWLQDWGEPVVDTTSPADHSAHGAGNMMSSGDMSQLMVAGGPEFDRLFVDGMIKHHEGAIAMAQIEIGSGQYGRAKSVARSIVQSQTAEIEAMKKLEL